MAIADPLFGWINWRWMTVDSIDAHILVIVIMFGSAVGRASTDIWIAQGDSRSSAMVLGAIASLVIVVLPVLLLLSVLPKPFDAAAGVLTFLGICTTFGLVAKHRDGDLSPARIVLRELIGVFAVVVLLVAANYAVFRP